MVGCACPVCKRWKFQEGIFYPKILKFAQKMNWKINTEQRGACDAMWWWISDLWCDFFWPKFANIKLTESNKGERTLFIVYWFRSIIEQLVRLDTFIPDAFVNKEHAVSIFFDLEIAYDTTWKYGILKDLHSIGFKGHLPNFIKKFLDHRNLNIRLGSTISDNFE